MKMELRSRALDKLYKRRDRIEMPDFQREEVWTDDQKRRLIDSILRGWHLPKFYFRKVEEASFECVDGQQRLAAIWEFYDNKLRLEPAAAQKFGGATYAELGPDHSDAFDDFEIDIEELIGATDEDLEELFVRLQLGTPLTTAEKLNAIGGDARDFCRRVADQPFFAQKVGVRDTRYAHFDLAAKWLFVEARGIQPQMRYPQLERFLRDNRAFDQESGAGKQLKASLDYLEKAIPAQAEFLRNRASVLSVAMLAASVVRARLGRGTSVSFGRFLHRFFDDLAKEVEKGPKASEKDLLEYQEAISYGSTSGESVKRRLEILSQRLANFDPAFAPLIGKGESSALRTSATLEQLGEDVAELVYADNERYSASSGEDRFKITNKSMRALKRLAKPRSTEQTFLDLADDLYFLVYEATGNCARLPEPPPDYAMDVKFLRGWVRHDFDHGSTRDAATKRKRGAAALKKYSGKASLGECGPAEFLNAHQGLLRAFKEMLGSLA